MVGDKEQSGGGKCSCSVDVAMQCSKRLSLHGEVSGEVDFQSVWQFGEEVVGCCSDAGGGEGEVVGCDIESACRGTVVGVKNVTID